VGAGFWGVARGRRLGAVLLAAAVPLVAWLGPGVWALLQGVALPSTYGWRQVAGWAPWVALIALAGWLPRRRSALTVRSALALALGVFGAPALVAAMAVIATGRLEAGHARSGFLIVAVAMLVLGWGMELYRFALRGMLSVALGIGPDAALLVLGGVLAAVSAVGWWLVGWWALR
jgi:hypothetical protein